MLQCESIDQRSWNGCQHEFLTLSKLEVEGDFAFLTLATEGARKNAILGSGLT